MLDGVARVVRVEVEGQSFTLQRHPWRRAQIEALKDGIVVLRVTSHPDAALSDIEGTLREFIADDALPTPEQAKSSGPAEAELWQPAQGRKRPDGAIELAVTVMFETCVTDHGVHRCVERSWWTETGEDLGLQEGSDENHDSVADDVICFIGDELTEGQRYVLLLKIDGRGESHTHFTYFSKHWPPSNA